MLCREPAQPRGELECADAVDPVVVADVIENLLRGGVVALLAQFAGADVLGDRVVAARDNGTFARLGPVDRLEVLDRVAGAADAQGVLDDRVQVDEHAAAQPLVDDVFADTVARGERAQVGALVGGVVVDVQVGVHGTAGLDVGEEVDERLPLVGEAVRPVGSEVGVRIDHSEQVVDAPLARVVLGVERVALEVEVEVAGARGGQCVQRAGGAHRHGRRTAGGGPGGLCLEVGLDAQRVERRAGDARLLRDGGSGAVVDAGQLAQGRDADGAELRPLRSGEPGHLADVVVGDNLGHAPGAAAAVGDLGVAPGDRLALGHPRAQQPVQPLAAGAQHGRDVVELVAARLAISEDQPHLGVDGDAEPLELLGVGGELQQRGDLRAAGELAVEHAVAAVGHPLEEVGVADEGDRRVVGPGCGAVVAVDEGALHDERHARLQGVERLLRGHLDRGKVAVDARDLEHRIRAPARLGELRAVIGDDGELVSVAERGRAGEHGIGLVEDGGQLAQLGVEVARDGELALGGAREVARRGDEQAGTVVGAGQIHAVSLSEGWGDRGRRQANAASGHGTIVHPRPVVGAPHGGAVDAECAVREPGADQHQGLGRGEQVGLPGLDVRSDGGGQHVGRRVAAGPVDAHRLAGETELDRHRLGVADDLRPALRAVGAVDDEEVVLAMHADQVQEVAQRIPGRQRRRRPAAHAVGVRERLGLRARVCLRARVTLEERHRPGAEVRGLLSAHDVSVPGTSDIRPR